MRAVARERRVKLALENIALRHQIDGADAEPTPPATATGSGPPAAGHHSARMCAELASPHRDRCGQTPWCAGTPAGRCGVATWRHLPKSRLALPSADVRVALASSQNSTRADPADDARENPRWGHMRVLGGAAQPSAFEVSLLTVRRYRKDVRATRCRSWRTFDLENHRAEIWAPDFFAVLDALVRRLALRLLQASRTIAARSAAR